MRTFSSTEASTPEKPDPGDVDGYWVEPDDRVYDRIDHYWIDFETILVPHVRKQKWRMWADHGLEFFIHPAMQARPAVGGRELERHPPRGGLKAAVRDTDPGDYGRFSLLSVNPMHRETLHSKYPPHRTDANSWSID
jgi:hypothetical protein